MFPPSIRKFCTRPVLVFAALIGAAGSPVAAASHVTREQPNGQAGVFDYYLLSLSWSPSFCASSAGANDPGQCSGNRHYGFVVHGLWPQYERGFPSNCSSDFTLDQATVDQMLAIMPSPKLVRHEWYTHGVCSGLDSKQYFRTIQNVFGSLRIPAKYREPTSAISISPAQLKEELRGANPLLTEGTMAALCRGQYLSEVRICFDKALKARQCSREVHDQCRESEMILRPVR